MPKIQEYLPETEAQGPVGQTSPMLEQVAMFGRGIEDAGRSLEDAGNVVRQRQTMAESSDASAVVAEQREAYMNRIQQATNDGTLDDKGLEEIKKEYQSWQEKQIESYDTAGGKDAFVRASTRTGGAILQHAAIGQAVVAGNKAKNDANTMVNSYSNILMNDPSQFADLHEQATEYVNSQVQSGLIKPEIASRIQTAFNQELAKGAVRGYMQSDYARIKEQVQSSGGKVDPNSPKLNTAQSALMAGAFDGFIDSDIKHALQQEIKSNQRSAQDAGILAIKQQAELEDTRNTAFKATAHDEIVTGKYDPSKTAKAVRDKIIDPSEAAALDKLAIAQATKGIDSNPTFKTELMARILSSEGEKGHISDPFQLAPYVATSKGQTSFPGSKKISKEDYNELVLQFQATNAPLRIKEATLFETAKAKMGDGPDGANRVAKFMLEVQHAKQDAIKENKPLAPLFDSKNPDSFFHRMESYIPTPQDILKKKAEAITTKSQFDVSKYDLSNITKVDQTKLTPAQRNALRDRYKELKAAKQ